MGEGNIMITKIISILTAIFILIPVGVQAVYGQVVETTNLKLYQAPFAINGEVVLERGAVTNEGKRYYHLEELVHRLGGDMSFSEENISININEKALFRLGLQEAEIPSFKDEILFEEVVNAYAAVLIGDSPLHVLYSKNEQEKLFPASTTKIMTALIALEHGDLTETVKVSEQVSQIPSNSSKANIRPGDVLTLEQLLYAMMIPSGNDAAVAVSTHIAGSEEKFADLMNEKAREVGATNTNFVNSHGYHDEEQYTTAIDLAKIAYEASKQEHFYPLVSTFSYNATYLNKNGDSISRTWQATNEQLNRNSPYYSTVVTGGKTGFTTPSRHTLVSFAEKKGYQYITVILKGDRGARYNDTERLVNRVIELRSAYDKERKIEAELLQKNCSISLNGKEMMLGQLSIVENEDIYIPVESFLKLKETVKNEMIRKSKMELVLDQMYFPNKHFFQKQGQLYIPFRPPFIAYNVATTFRNSIEKKRDTIHAVKEKTWPNPEN